MDCERLAECIEKYTPERVAFVRLEAGTNLIGGQPFSLQNLRDVRQVRAGAGQGRTSAWGSERGAACAAAPGPRGYSTCAARPKPQTPTPPLPRQVCDKYRVLLVMDASLLADNLHFVYTREKACRGMTVREITRAMADLVRGRGGAGRDRAAAAAAATAAGGSPRSLAALAPPFCPSTHTHVLNNTTLQCDILYFSARKLGCARGGGICIRSQVGAWAVPGAGRAGSAAAAAGAHRHAHPVCNAPSLSPWFVLLRSCTIKCEASCRCTRDS